METYHFLREIKLISLTHSKPSSSSSVAHQSAMKPRLLSVSFVPSLSPKAVHTVELTLVIISIHVYHVIIRFITCFYLFCGGNCNVSAFVTKKFSHIENATMIILLKSTPYTFLRFTIFSKSSILFLFLEFLNAHEQQGPGARRA